MQIITMQCFQLNNSPKLNDQSLRSVLQEIIFFNHQLNITKRWSSVKKQRQFYVLHGLAEMGGQKTRKEIIKNFKPLFARFWETLKIKIYSRLDFNFVNFKKMQKLPTSDKLFKFVSM